MQKPNPILGPMRPPFLILAPVCAFLAISIVAFQSPSSLSFIKIFLVVIGAIAAHISVNTFNEYFDFKSGLDFKTMKTPFSGGSGALPASPDKARIALVGRNYFCGSGDFYWYLLYGHLDQAAPTTGIVGPGDHYHLHCLAQPTSILVLDRTRDRFWIAHGGWIRIGVIW